MLLIKIFFIKFQRATNLHTLLNTRQNFVGALIKHTYKEPVAFYFLCGVFRQQQGWNEEWDDETKTPYAYNGDQWIGFDNIKSVKIKVLKKSFLFCF
jgi:GH18 family chitinase